MKAYGVTPYPSVFKGSVDRDKAQYCRLIEEVPIVVILVTNTVESMSRYSD
jgi:hypothetical protein